MQMPPLDPAILARRSEIVAALRAIVPGEGVIDDLDGMRPYECDALSAYRQMPLVVVLPETASQVAEILRFCFEHQVKVVPRGAGTSLSGGALPLADGVLLGLGKFNRILDVDFANRTVTAQPGVTNLAITKAVEQEGFYYAPDPSSQIACSIGGNVAENSGGVHCLKYGLTTNNLLGLEMVLISGEIIRLGGKHLDSEGYDLLGLMTGSEGLLGVITEVTVRILKKPDTARAMLIGFASNEAAGQCVADVISAGIIPGGMEMMDRPAIHAVEAFIAAGYPLDAEALLIVEVDGPSVEVDQLIGRIEAIAKRNGASSLRISTSEDERLLFWAGRKAAFPAAGRLSPDYLCMDGTIPRRELPALLRKLADLSAHYGLRVANVFHAGDGNLHPLILYDANNAEELHRTAPFAAEVLEKCIAVGGTITGEHGVGVEKINQMCAQFGAGELEAFLRIKRAFDPAGLLNPGKAVPTLARCGEYRGFRVGAAQPAHSELPRF